MMKQGRVLAPWYLGRMKGGTFACQSYSGANFFEG